MPDLLTSVPAQPGMLTRGAPVAWPRRHITQRGVVVDLLPDGRCVLATMSDDGSGRASDPTPLASVSLDLTTPLGRAAGWAWVYERWDAERAERPDDTEEARILRAAHDWRDMSPTQIDRFARLILAAQP